MTPHEALPAAADGRPSDDDRLEMLLVHLVGQIEQQMTTLERTEHVKRMIRMIEVSLGILVTIIDTGSPDLAVTLTSPPTGVVHFQARGVDAQSQPGPWSARGRLESGVTAVPTGMALAPTSDRVGPSSPNPFNPVVTVRF